MAERHAAYFCARAEAAAPHLHARDAAYWLAQLDDDHANMLAALDRMHRHGDRSTVVRFVQALGWFWVMRGYLHEGREWITRTLPLPPACATSMKRLRRTPARVLDLDMLAEAYLTAGYLYFFQGDFLTARAYGHVTVALRRAIGEDSKLALALLTLSATYWLNGDLCPGPGATCRRASASRAAGRRRGTGMAVARPWARRAASRQAARGAQLTRSGVVLLPPPRRYIDGRHVLLDLTQVLLALGEDRLAASHAAESLAISRALKSQVATAYALERPW